MGARKKTAAKKTRVLVVDDHPLLRFALAQLLNKTADLTCCGEADGVLLARTALKQHAPDLVLLDLSLADGDGFELIQEWKLVASV